MEASFLSQCDQYLYYHMFDQTLYSWTDKQIEAV